VSDTTVSIWTGNVTDRLTRLLGILTGRDGTTAASVTNGVPVAPETSSVWNISDRAARLLGAITGANGSGVASITNAVPVGGIDGGGTARTVLTNAAGATQIGFHQGTSYSSAAAESSAVISASATRISQVRVQNLGASTRYLHLFNAASLPANGTVPKAVLALAAGASGAITFAIPTDRFSTGCVVACSTVQGTLTLSAGADFLIAVDIFPASA
jgi:hypothetical protein